MAKQVKAFKRFLSARKFEHLRKVVTGETRVKGGKPYLDQFTGRIVQFGLEEIDVRRYVMGDISLLAD